MQSYESRRLTKNSGRVGLGTGGGPLESYLKEIRKELERALLPIDPQPEPSSSMVSISSTLSLMAVSSSSFSSSEESSVSSDYSTSFQAGDEDGYPIRPIVELGPNNRITRVVIYKAKQNPYSTKRASNNFKLRGMDEFCCVESSVNSVRVSFRFKQDGIIDPAVSVAPNSTSLEIPTASASTSSSGSVAVAPSGDSGSVQQQPGKIKTNPLELAILTKYRAFFQHDADQHHILRRRPVPGYSISFLIVPCHLERIGRDRIISKILSFVEKLDQEINQVKINVNSQARRCSVGYFKEF